jgi:hypothetical protein
LELFKVNQVSNSTKERKKVDDSVEYVGKWYGVIWCGMKMVAYVNSISLILKNLYAELFKQKLNSNSDYKKSKTTTPYGHLRFYLLILSWKRDDYLQPRPPSRGYPIFFLFSFSCFIFLVVVNLNFHMLVKG